MGVARTAYYSVVGHILREKDPYHHWIPVVLSSASLRAHALDWPGPLRFHDYGREKGVLS